MATNKIPRRSGSICHSIILLKLNPLSPIRPRSICNALFKSIALSTVNQIIGNNLFLTLSVCHGAYLLGNVQIDKPAPFIGFVGSFDLIYNSDSLMRYTEFYDAFLMSFDLGKAIQRFLNANTLNPNTFNLIDTEETFKSVYKKYLLENTTKDGIKKRWKNSIISENLKFNSRQHKRFLER